MTNNTLIDLVSQASKKLDMRDYAEAQKLYEEALSIQKGNSAALMGMAMVYNRTNKPELAKNLLSSLLKLFKPQKIKRGKKLKKQAMPSPIVQATIYAQLGVAQQLLGETKDALKMYKKAIALHPSAELEHMIDAIENPSPKLSIQEKILQEANAFLRIKKLDEAQYILKKGLEKFPNDAPLLHQMGMLLRHVGKSTQALPLVQQAIILNPDEALYYNDLGMIFQDFDNHKKAITFYKRAIAKKPDYAIAYNNIGVAYKKLEMIPEAIEAYKKALQINENLAPVHNNLGNLLRLTGKKKKAIKHLKKALEIAPQYEDAKKNLAAILENNDD